MNSAPLSGQTLAHFQFVELIGKGGMGEVYRARDTKLGREVAVKVLPAEFNRDDERLARFQREARSLASLQHPNIASIYGLEEVEGHRFLVMELAEGEDLSELLMRESLPVKQALEIARQVADGLADAHDKGIVHRDLKPGNIKLTDEGKVKILDFGLARLEGDEHGETDGASDSSLLNGQPMPATILQTSEHETQPGVVLGTMGYMAPEQVRGNAVDARADIFSFGAVLYEMLCGRRAFTGDTAADVIGAVLRDDPEPVRTTEPSISEAVDRIVMRCMAKRPTARFQSARDLAFALDNVSPSSGSSGGLAGPGMAFGPMGDAGREGARASASRTNWLGLLGWLAFLAAAATMLVVLPRLKGPAAIAEPVRLSTITFSGRDWSPTASADGSLMAFVSDRDGVPRIWLKQIGGAGEKPLTEGSDDLPHFSPDGAQILFVRDTEGERSLYRTAVLGGSPRKVLDDVTEGDWSPDGTQVVFTRARPVEGNNEFSVGIADVATAEERILVAIDNRNLHGVRWSPDGKYISLSEGSVTGNVGAYTYLCLIDVETGELDRRALNSAMGPYTCAAWSPTSASLVVAQSLDLLSHASGNAAVFMEYSIDDGRTSDAFWAPIRIPRGGWGASSIAYLGDGKLVFDDEQTNAQLHLLPLRPEDPSLLGGNVLRETTPLSRGLARDRQPAFSPDGSEVIFSSNRSGNVDLWIVDVKSGELHQVTDDLANDWDPAFTADGNGILWSSDRSGSMEIWMAALDGSRARQVSSDGVDAENPTMTPNGEWIVYSSSNSDKIGIWKIRPDGSEAARIFEGATILPEVSPDGRYAAFSLVRNLDYYIEVADIASGGLVDFEIQLIPTERRTNLTLGRVRWTPDGGALVFVGQDEAGLSGVYRQDFVIGQDTSSTLRKLAGFSPEFETESLGISPDGESLVISTNYEIRTIRMAEFVSLTDW